MVVTIMIVAAAHLTRHKPGQISAASANLKGQEAPNFTLQSLEGKQVSLSDFRGKVVLLNFWATWCQPCKIEMPWFVELQKQYASQGLQVLGVAMDDASAEDIGKFAKDMGVNYPVLIGKESVGDEYGGVQFLPATFYISRDGKVRDKIFGLKSRGEIEDEVKGLLAESSVAKKE